MRRPTHRWFTELCFVEAKAEAGMVFELVTDLTAATLALPRERAQQRILALLDEAIRHDVHFLARHPTTLFQCLWNSCWWYDCPEAAPHYKRPARGSLQPPPWERRGQKIQELLETWRAAKEGTMTGFAWLRSQRPPSTHLGTAQRRPVARFPVPLDHISTFRIGRGWVGTSANHLYIITLEGGEDISKPKAESGKPDGEEGAR